MKSLPIKSDERRIEYKIEVGRVTNELEINKIYISNPPTPNPLIHNKGNTRKIFSEIRTFEFDKNIIEEILNAKNKVGLDSCITSIDEEKHIPSPECIDLDKDISSYLFGFSEHLNNKSMKKLNIKKKSFKNDKNNRSSTPLNYTKEYYLSQEKLFDKMWYDSQIKFQAICSKFKENYFEEVLKNKKIFFQYVEIANCEDEITRTISFKKKAAKT